MKKKQTILAAAAAAVLLLVGCVGFFFATHTHVGGQYLKKNAQSFDLRGKSLSMEDYEQIREAFPDAQIQWSVPVQGQALPEDTSEVTVTALTEADLEALKHLPELAFVNAEQCTDYELLMQLRQELPEVEVSYNVDISGTEVNVLQEKATVKDASFDALNAGLSLLPELRQLELIGSLPDEAQILKLSESYPDVQLLMDVKLAGQTFRTDAKQIDLRGMELDSKELSRKLPLFGSLEEVNLLESSLTEEECRALADGKPETFFLFAYTLANMEFTTDAEEVDISGKSVTVEEAEAIVPYFRNLKKVIMANCGIENEDMDALNRRHEDIKFVWTVKISNYNYRTDMLYFYPWQQGLSKGGFDCYNLRYCTDMVAIDIGHYWITDCSFLEYTPHIKYLIIAMTGCHDITPVGTLQELEYLEVFEMVVDDYSPLLNCKALRDLNVGTTYADPAPLFKMTWLENLYMYCGKNNLIKHGYEPQELVDALPNTNVVFDLIRNCGQEWRYLPRYYIFRDIIHNGYLNQYSARAYWGNEDMDAILACRTKDELFAGDVLAEIIARRKANGEYIPGIKNSGPKPQAIINGTP